MHGLQEAENTIFSHLAIFQPTDSRKPVIWIIHPEGGSDPLGSSSLALELFKKVSPPMGNHHFSRGPENQVFSIYLPERVRPGHKNFIAPTHVLILYLAQRAAPGLLVSVDM